MSVLTSSIMLVIFLFIAEEFIPLLLLGIYLILSYLFFFGNLFLLYEFCRIFFLLKHKKVLIVILLKIWEHLLFGFHDGSNNILIFFDHTLSNQFPILVANCSSLHISRLQQICGPRVVHWHLRFLTSLNGIGLGQRTTLCYQFL